MITYRDGAHIYMAVLDGDPRPAHVQIGHNTKIRRAARPPGISSHRVLRRQRRPARKPRRHHHLHRRPHQGRATTTLTTIDLLTGQTT